MVVVLYCIATHCTLSLQSPFFTQHDIASLIQEGERDGYRGVDILLTSEWPQKITNEATPLVSDGPSSYPAVDHTMVARKELMLLG